MIDYITPPYIMHFFLLCILTYPLSLFADPTADTVIIEFEDETQIIIYAETRAQLKQLNDYNINQIVSDLPFGLGRSGAFGDVRPIRREREVATFPPTANENRRPSQLQTNRWGTRVAVEAHVAILTDSAEH